MRALRTILSAILWVGVVCAQPTPARMPVESWGSRCSSYLLNKIHWLTRRPNRVVATVNSYTLRFTFGQGTVKDTVEIVAKGRKYLVYSGRITRIPVRKEGWLRGPGKVPAAVAHRVSSYTDDHYSQWEFMRTISTEDGALVISFVPGFAQIELGIGMHKWPGVFTILRLPTRLKYLAKASVGSLGKRIPPEDPEVDWHITMYGEEYAMVTLAESDTSKNYLAGGPELRAALTNLIDMPDGTRVYDYPTDNQETWVVKADGLFEDRTPAEFPYAVHEFGTRAMRLADHAFSGQAKRTIVADKLTIGANGPQSVDSEYIVLGDVVHESGSWDLGELDRESSEIPLSLRVP